MKIAVIGTGNVGSALGGSFARAGHDVTFAARDAAKAAEVARPPAAPRPRTPSTAAAGADVVVLAVPFTAHPATSPRRARAGHRRQGRHRPHQPADARLLGPGDRRRIVRPPSGSPAASRAPTSSRRSTPCSRTVQADPGALGTTVDALIAADDDAAAETVDALASSIGFRPVNVGPLAAARELEGLAFLNIRLQLLAGGAWQTSVVLVAPPEAALAA